jgi:major membrane immunogen (membrane-anchored lipoprotein)
MKRIVIAVMAMTLIAAGIAVAEVKAKDGMYFAQSGEFSKSGWRAQVVLQVKAGKIVKAVWNGVANIAGAVDKKAYAKAGKYGMAKAAKQGEWDIQAAAAEAWLVKTQDVGFNKFDAAGHTDAIAGATISVSEFFDLANKALAAPAVPKGMYKKDGWYYAEQADFDAKSGWKDTVLVTVVNGTVVDVLWNGISNDAAKKSKLVEAVEGRYGMAKAAKQGEWNVQAAAVQDAIVKAQDPAKIAVKADGTSDAITGASIHVTAVSLAIEALKAAR